jgi:hypothetical protein
VTRLTPVNHDDISTNLLDLARDQCAGENESSFEGFVQPDVTVSNGHKANRYK